MQRGRDPLERGRRSGADRARRAGRCRADRGPGVSSSVSTRAFESRAARSSCGWKPWPISSTVPADFTVATSSGDSSRSCGSAPGGVRFVTCTRGAADLLGGVGQGIEGRDDAVPVARVESPPAANAATTVPTTIAPMSMIMILILISRYARRRERGESSSRLPAPGAGSGRRPQRVRVVEELAREHNDVTAGELYDRLRATRRPHRPRDRLPHAGAPPASTARSTRSPTTRASSATGSAATSTTITSSARAATASSSSRTATSSRG